MVLCPSFDSSNSSNRPNKIKFMKLTPMSMSINSSLVSSLNLMNKYTAFLVYTSLSLAVYSNLCSKCNNKCKCLVWFVIRRSLYQLSLYSFIIIWDNSRITKSIPTWVGFSTLVNPCSLIELHLTCPYLINFAALWRWWKQLEIVLSSTKVVMLAEASGLLVPQV
mgnify:CR=1 FL=1